MVTLSAPPLAARQLRTASARARPHFLSPSSDLASVLDEATPGGFVGSKVVATLGPSSHTVPQLVGLLRAGMNVARIDLTWGTLRFHEATLANLNEAGVGNFALAPSIAPAMKRCHKMCAVMVDTLGREVMIRRPFVEDPGKEQPGVGVVVTYAGLGALVQPGDMLYVGRYLACGAPEQGSLYLRVDKVVAGCVHCVAQGSADLSGLLTLLHVERSEQGVTNAQPGWGGGQLWMSSLRVLSQYDKDCLAHLANQFELDFLGLSYTRSLVHWPAMTADDGMQAHQVLPSLVPSTTSCNPQQWQVVSKLETRLGLLNFQAIAEASAAVIVSRGMLGLDVAAEKMALVQKALVAGCNLLGKPVIVTRVLDSMSDSPRPTRAEATDVANIILDGADGVLLGAETLRGRRRQVWPHACRHPVEAVRMALAISRQAEAVFDHKHHFDYLMESAMMDSEDLLGWNMAMAADSHLMSHLSHLPHPPHSSQLPHSSHRAHSSHSSHSSHDVEAKHAAAYHHSLGGGLAGPQATNGAHMSSHSSSMLASVLARHAAAIQRRLSEDALDELDHVGEAAHWHRGAHQHHLPHHHHHAHGMPMHEGTCQLQQQPTLQTHHHPLRGAGPPAAAAGSGRGSAAGLATTTITTGTITKSSGSTGRMKWVDWTCPRRRPLTMMPLGPLCWLLPPPLTQLPKVKPSSLMLPPVKTKLSIVNCQLSTANCQLPTAGPLEYLYPGAAGGGVSASGLPYLSKLESITSSAVRAAEKVRAGLILVITHTSRAAQLIAKYRPAQPIMTLVVPKLVSDGLTWRLEGRSHARTCLMTRGLLPLLSAPGPSGDEVLEEAIATATRWGLVKPGQQVVVVERVHEHFAIKVVAVDSDGLGIKKSPTRGSTALALMYAQQAAAAAAAGGGLGGLQGPGRSQAAVWGQGMASQVMRSMVPATPMVGRTLSMMECLTPFNRLSGSGAGPTSFPPSPAYPFPAAPPGPPYPSMGSASMALAPAPWPRSAGAMDRRASWNQAGAGGLNPSWGVPSPAAMSQPGLSAAITTTASPDKAGNGAASLGGEGAGQSPAAGLAAEHAAADPAQGLGQGGGQEGLCLLLPDLAQPVVRVLPSEAAPDAPPAPRGASTLLQALDKALAQGAGAGFMEAEQRQRSADAAAAGGYDTTLGVLGGMAGGAYVQGQQQGLASQHVPHGQVNTSFGRGALGGEQLEQNEPGPSYSGSLAMATGSLAMATDAGVDSDADSLGEFAETGFDSGASDVEGAEAAQGALWRGTPPSSPSDSRYRTPPDTPLPATPSGCRARTPSGSPAPTFVAMGPDPERPGQDAGTALQPREPADEAYEVSRESTDGAAEDSLADDLWDVNVVGKESGYVEPGEGVGDSAVRYGADGIACERWYEAQDSTDPRVAPASSPGPRRFA
ncbi:hypothetical protein V8C86DRAFT_3172018 [Haematococcus lacustris]